MRSRALIVSFVAAGAVVAVNAQAPPRFDLTVDRIMRAPDLRTAADLPAVLEQLARWSGLVEYLLPKPGERSEREELLACLSDDLEGLLKDLASYLRTGFLLKRETCIRDDELACSVALELIQQQDPCELWGARLLLESSMPWCRDDSEQYAYTRQLNIRDDIA